MERVTYIRGNKGSNLMIVAPHGIDDTRTDLICHEIHQLTGCYTLINNGFSRCENIDTLNDRANCNNRMHCLDPVVFEEFTQFLELFGTKMESKPFPGFIYFIHGSNFKQDGYILGYGKGVDKDRLTMKTIYIQEFERNLITTGAQVSIADAGSKYAARHKNNMTQYFRYQLYMPNIQTVQVEINSNLRDEDMYEETALDLASAIVQ